MKRLTLLLFILLCIPSVVDATNLHRHNQTIKEVFFAQDKNTIIAVDLQSRRNVEFRLRLRETILNIIETDVTIAVATDRRLFGFSQRGSGWVPIKLKLKEQVIRLRARDFAIFAETNQRFLSFDALNGNWQSRRKSLR
ncbi:MAG: hypothetical protein HOM11_08345 [Methylococcales bacterium]|jgi:hypothetical protein|nr:hypothetical protein [Methylococcales bacterium]MBT7445326.1 hypothetical protein [Methylococcales bacterium]